MSQNLGELAYLLWALDKCTIGFLARSMYKSGWND